MEIKFNVNEYVKVKLNDFGREIHKEDWTNTFKNYGEFVYRKPPEDENGYSKFQMWELMQLFGPYISLGRENPFDTEIIIVTP